MAGRGNIDRGLAALDRWSGMLARPAGFALLIYSGVFDRFRNPALLPIAAGLICLKSVTRSNGAGD